MKVLLLNGSPHEQGCTATALHEVAETLQAQGIDTQTFWIGRAPVSGCIDCKVCKKTGRCVFDDLANQLAEAMADADGLVVGSPVYFAGPSGQVQALLDRLFRIARPVLTGKPAAAVVSCRRGGASAAFDRLNKYFSICNMPIVTSQYWNQVHGNTPQEVMQDAEGLQTMRTLGANMAYMLKSFRMADEQGIVPPVYEPAVHTNFIRP